MAKKKNEIISAEAHAMDKMALSREEADKLWGDGQPFDLVRVETRIGTNNTTVIGGMVASGRDYHWAKAYVDHGEFMALVDRTASSHTYVLNCMRFADLYPNSAPVPNLGVRKTKALTLLDKPVVEKYLSGGPLGDIPHDDVAEMTVRELETEVRKLRKKCKEEKTAQEDAIAEKNQKISELERKLRYLAPISEKEKVAKAIEDRLETLRTNLHDNINKTRLYFHKALETITEATQLEGVTFPMLEKWAHSEYEELAGFNELFEELDDALNYCNPDKGDGDRS